MTRRGTYGREFLTPYGRIADLRVPKLRRGNRERPWQTIARSERCWGPLLAHHIMGYCVGLSLRDRQEVLYETLGEVVSLSACNRLLWEVDKQIKAWTSAGLEVPPEMVRVDGMGGKIASPTGAHCLDAQGRLRAVQHKEKRVVLSARGLWDAGHWEIVHWQIAPGANQAAWPHFLGELYQKGLTEETTKLVVSDGSAGLESALDYHSYGVPHQRCLFHKIKNLADHLGFDEVEIEAAQDADKALRQARQARKKAILAAASAGYADQVEAEIRPRAAPCRDTWQGREPQAVGAFFVDTLPLSRALANLLAFAPPIPCPP